MSASENKAWLWTTTNFKRKIRNPQTLVYLLGFPVMFTIMFYFIFGRNPVEGTDLQIFDQAFPGFAIYASGMAVVNAAISFAADKKTGMLERLDTLPIGRKNLFIGAVGAESLFVLLSTGLIFVIGYGGLQLHYANPIALLLGFLLALIFGIQCVGLGILFASFAKGPEAANGFAMMYILPVLYASGAFVPFESSIVYVMPPYWVKQVFLQVTVYGDSLTDEMYSSSLIGLSATPIGIPLWGGLLIFIAITIVFFVAGLIVFQKRTRV